MLKQLREIVTIVALIAITAASLLAIRELTRTSKAAFETMRMSFRTLDSIPAE